MPLQKSFSDQNHSAKAKVSEKFLDRDKILIGTQQQQQRPNWNRNKSFQGPSTTKSNGQSKPLQEKLPIPVSTATKNKLSNFQFMGDAKAASSDKDVINLVSDDEKENRVGGSRKATGSDKNSEKKAREVQPVLPDLPRNDVPSTPGSRLALPDLIGMGDVKRAVQTISPDERIEWDYDKDNVHSSASSFGGVKRAKKRARSSSPVTSPPAHASAHFSTREALNPQFDPGSELWGRYSLNGSNVPTPQGASIPALAYLMQTSSPQPSKEGNTPRAISGFRRANSCGNQFPKRRKVGDSQDGDVFTESANIGPSKLSVLIERVQEGLTQPQRRTNLNPPAASSHVSEKRLHSAIDNGSPTLAEGRSKIPAPVAEPVSNSLPAISKSTNSSSVGQRPVLESNSSDYGDFDDEELDVSFFEALESKPVVSPPATPKQLTSKRPPDPPPPALSSSEKTNLPGEPAKKSSSILKFEDDEFGDFDGDLVDGYLEQVLSQYDQKAPSVNPVRSPAIFSSKNINQRQKPVSKSDSDDEFGVDGLDDSDFEAAEVAATQPPTQKRAIQRYLVTNILEGDYETPHRRRQTEKILLLQIENTKTTVVVHLRGVWYDTPVTVKAYVHVIGRFDNSGRCIIDDEENMLILHPDHLISSTVVGDSFGCARRAVLQDRVKVTSDSSAPLIYGTILHEIFQTAMIANRWDSAWLDEVIEDIATRHIEDLYTIKLQISQAVDHLKSKMPELQSWAELFVSSQPKSDANVKDRNGETATMCVSKLLDVEEHVWSPMYGLKGNIDATVQVTMKDRRKTRVLTVPFEVKTGKNASASHRAQTALYSLLLSDRYDVEIAYGILYYMETSETIRIPAIRHELRHMIMQRNELACFVRERHAQLPPMQKKDNLCSRCYANVPCFIYHRLADNGTAETSGVKTKFDEIVKHLTPKHKEFFLKWDDLLTKEEKETLKFRRELWTMLSSEREKLGRCFSNVIIKPRSAYEDQSNPKINRFSYTLIKDDHRNGFSFLDSQLTVGEAIVISDEKGHFALAKGYVSRVNKRSIAVAVDRRLHNARIRQPGFDEADNQVFASIMEVEPSVSAAAPAGTEAEEPIRYRLDKDEFSNGMATVRNNLIQVMADGPFGSRKIRGLAVDLNAPRFKTQSTAYVLRDRDSINVDQRRAIHKVMSAEDYALVLGMPGTGKTTTIAHIIRALVSQGKSVLLTSYTHSAVDNILLKLKDDNMGILRLGTLAKIHPEVQEFATLAVKPKSSFEEIRSAWHDTPIVATSCLGISHPIFSERTFDYCIVDEASQITLPVCLGPIRLARTFVLVGDHNQLPPLVKNEEARAGGLDISLFKLLSDTHPNSVVYLEHQYRMCEDVMALSNNLIYNGRLKCGSQEVANRRISIPNIGGLTNYHFSPSTLSRSQKTICLGGNRGCWLYDLIKPETKVAFINTDPLLPVSREDAKGNRIVNHTEANICTQLVEALLSVGVPATSIGVMTHYRSQLALLEHGLRNHNDIEMHTADRFQGRDKEVIILSLVRSNDNGSIGELLKDWRRINVAFTRAKTKLLVIGSRETLKGTGKDKDGNEKEEMVASFVKLMEKKSWIYDLPKSALDDHYFQDEATQITNSAMSRPPLTQARLLKEKEEKTGMKRKAVLDVSILREQRLIFILRQRRFGEFFSIHATTNGNGEDEHSESSSGSKNGGVTPTSGESSNLTTRPPPRLVSASSWYAGDSGVGDVITIPNYEREPWEDDEDEEEEEGDDGIYKGEDDSGNNDGDDDTDSDTTITGDSNTADGNGETRGSNGNSDTASADGEGEGGGSSNRNMSPLPMSIENFIRNIDEALSRNISPIQTFGDYNPVPNNENGEGSARGGMALINEEIRNPEVQTHVHPPHFQSSSLVHEARANCNSDSHRRVERSVRGRDDNTRFGATMIGNLNSTVHTVIPSRETSNSYQTFMLASHRSNETIRNPQRFSFFDPRSALSILTNITRMPFYDSTRSSGELRNLVADHQYWARSIWHCFRWNLEMISGLSYHELDDQVILQASQALIGSSLGERDLQSVLQGLKDWIGPRAPLKGGVESSMSMVHTTIGLGSNGINQAETYSTIRPSVARARRWGNTTQPVRTYSLLNHVSADTSFGARTLLGSIDRDEHKNGNIESRVQELGSSDEEYSSSEDNNAKGRGRRLDTSNYVSVNTQTEITAPPNSPTGSNHLMRQRTPNLGSGSYRDVFVSQHGEGSGARSEGISDGDRIVRLAIRSETSSSFPASREGDDGEHGEADRQAE
ncbi:hypothetical protein G7Y89_g2281 [Cudoniella acicularis]|uniref:DNA replication ATP-dependent helicase/nuclease DNA2 n=1 Tax=Cudoniella acicularis TaxID=354080 RepID=A0A8H4W686_9HELO|nr:hypothetical protein G7Y89_g2281 [Cudoniella acicularis]